jgi:hypothetical protein
MSRSIFNTYKDFTNGTPDEPINVKWFGAVGDGLVAADGSTPDQTAIEAAIAYCVAKNLTLAIPDGTYAHKTAINWAFNYLHVMALGDNVVFLHTGTGIAHSFSGIANYPGTQGCVGGVFGGPGRIMLKGNPDQSTLEPRTTRVIDLDNWHQGYMKVALHDGKTAFYGNDTGIVHASAVETTFDLRITRQDGPWARRPGHGIEFFKPVACTFEKLIVENVGVGGLAAVALTGAANNLFRGGTIESNTGSGITEDSTCNHNTYIQVANEDNGGTNDWILSGIAPVLINCTGGGANGCLFNSTGATLIGGVFHNAVINDDSLWSNSTEFHGTFTNNGPHATLLNPLGGVATAVESAATILQFKTFNTANANTFKINSNTVNAVTGTGSTVALSASPLFTGSPTAPTATRNDNSTKIATTAYVDAAWISYTPSFIASETVGATLATYALNSARYKQIGKTITVAVDLTVTNQGVGNSGAILIGLPFTGAAFAYVGSLVEYNTTGDGGTVFVNISATRMYCAKATYAATLIVTGYHFVAQVTYEIP